MKKLTVTFRETMTGAFALGEADPIAGAEAGARLGTALALHASVRIDDIDAFVRDPTHTGSLAGSVDFPPFGIGLEGSAGVFNLFRPTEDPEATHMRYELAFRHDGKDYYLRGWKTVRDDPGFDLWSDTTTLHVTLHEGRDATGPVVGAGVLRLGVKDLAALLSTLDVPNAANSREKLEAIVKFGRFFAGKLWDGYVVPKFGRRLFGTTQDEALHFDVIVIGSGFGGAVTACRLAEKGARVCILERGRRWAPEDYPRGTNDAWLWSDECPERQNGWIDLKWFDDMAVAQGCGVGGGSLIYANVFVEAQPFVFESGWPKEITYEALKPYFEKTGAMLNVQEVPDNQWPPKMRLMKEAADRAGFGDRFRKMPLAVRFDPDFDCERAETFDPSQSKRFVNEHGLEQGTCIHCGNCDLGCPVGARNSLDLNYIPLAERHGAVVKPLHWVRRITPLDDGRGYRVDFERIDPVARKRVPGHFNARKVVVAAGTMGTNELLLRCRDQYATLPNLSKMLGRGWSSNGDFLTPALYAGRKISPTRGPTITSAIDFLDGSVGGHRFWVQDGGFPDIVANALEDEGGKGLRGWVFRSLLGAAQRHQLACVMPWFGQACDAADGELRLSRSFLPPFRQRLELEWKIERSEAVMDALVSMHKRLSKETGGVPLVPLSWQVFKDLITPHPLGGCRMGEGPDDGVVDHRGEVFGHPGLYVADGAIVPKAIGVNPSRTIAALAERIADLIEV